MYPINDVLNVMQTHVCDADTIYIDALIFDILLIKNFIVLEVQQKGLSKKISEK